jgi:hypothetical protein
MAESRHSRLAALLRYLRLLWSLVFCILFLLTVRLWARSYQIADYVRGPISADSEYCVWSIKGQLAFARLEYDNRSSRYERDTSSGSYPTKRVAFGNPLGRNSLGLRTVKTVLGEPAVVIPFWTPFLFLFSMILVVWVRPARSFSLSTLMIAMTVAAGVLGAVVSAVR